MVGKIKKLLLSCLIVFFSGAIAQAQDISVEGTVTDTETSETLPTVNVSIKGTTTGTSSNNDGHYSLVVPSLQDTLMFSFVGYETKEVPIAGRKEINIELVPKVFESEELVVTGFGEKREEISVVGSVQSISQPDQELQTATGSLTNAFAGRLAGVTAFQRSGEPGANASQFFIRGISTFSGATSPLVVIDGVEASTGDLNKIPPEIIESFSILKDATATAVYGSRGANGVMIVTTKTGANLDSPKINIRLENTITTPTSVPSFVGGAEYMELYNEAVLGRGTGEIPYSQEKIEGTRKHLNPYIFPDVDWYDELFKDQSMRQKVNVNIRGGGERVTYFMSGTLNRDNGMLKSFDLNSYDNNITVNDYQFQNNLDIHAGPSTDVSLKLDTQLRDYHGPANSTGNIFGMVMNVNPADIPLMFPPSDTVEHVMYGGIEASGGAATNPFANMTSGYKDSFESMINAKVQIKQDLDFLTEGLSFQGLANFKNWSRTETSRSKGFNLYEVDNYYKDDSGEYIIDLDRIGSKKDETLSTSNSSTGDRWLYFEARLNYERQLAEKHNISGMLLYNQDEFSLNSPSNLITSLPERTLGLAARVSYSYDDTYLAEFNAGYNGSENFAEGNRFGFFPSFALGYVVSNESFWKPISSVVNLFKLRGSWGLVGNDNVGGARFAYLPQINLGGQGFTTGKDQNYTRNGPTYDRFANRNLTWEVGEKLNLGLDLKLYESLDINVDVYREIRRDIFLERSTTPWSFGTAGTSIFGNLGKVKNQGIDVSVDFSHAFSSDLFMALKGTFTYSANEVLKRDEPPYTETPNLSSVGHPVNSLLGLDAQRLFIDEAEIEHEPEQLLGGFVMPGDIMYRDVHEDGKIDNDDRIHMGYPTVPEITFGFGPSFQYKNFDFSFLLQGSARTSFFIGGFHPFGTRDIRNVLSFVANDHWSMDNQDVFAGYPRLSKLDNANNTQNSSYWLRNGSFVKLRNVELGYNYKGFARIYISGRNLLTFSSFDKWDPEMGGGSGLKYPTLRSVNIGLHLNL